jgi:hypothetical protein
MSFLVPHQIELVNAFREVVPPPTFHSACAGLPQALSRGHRNRYLVTGTCLHLYEESRAGVRL